ncbi:OmpH family outer membrane protein [Desulfosarcina sp. OttesenSCG-928-A07]|nr:OmpH family outer membrane protein [Desulfosarcina sp. OttesenSCG-928-A07]
MHFVNIRTVFAILMVFIFTGTAFAADLKIGIVDMDRVFESTTSGKAIRAEFTAKAQQLETSFKQKGTEFEAFQKNLEREAQVMDAAMREKKRVEYEAKREEMQKLQRGYQGEMQELQQRLMGTFQKEIIDIIGQIAKSGKYTVIMDKRGGGVLFSRDNIDLTNEVIKRHDSLKAKGR